MRSGERRRKALRGCICGQDLSLLNVTITKVGDEAIAGVTDVTVPRRLGPKRVGKIRQLFQLSADADVKRWVVRRKAEVVAAVRAGLISLEDACRRYTLSVEEFASWQTLVDRYGVRGLRATRVQEYRGDSQQ